MSEPKPEPFFEGNIGWCSASCPFWGDSHEPCPARDLIPNYDPDPWSDECGDKVCFMWLLKVLEEREDLFVTIARVKEAMKETG